MHNKDIDLSFKIPIMAQLPFLNSINQEIKEKLDEITLNTPSRFKRGLVNGLGSLWKIISGNLDASDGEYYNNCINNLEKDDHSLQLLMKNQVQIVSSTIKNFNLTLKKLEIDESTFNKNMENIQRTLRDNHDTNQMQTFQLTVLVMIEQIMQINTILLDHLNNIINSISFSRLQILHPSVIDPEILLNTLSEIPQRLSHGNLAFSPSHENLSKLMAIIKIKAFQTNDRIIFILEIPIVEDADYTLYHIYSAPAKDPRTSLFHTIIPSRKYAAISQNSKQYLAVNKEDCEEIVEDEFQLCFDQFPKSMSADTPCEITALMESRISENCDQVITSIEDYNVQKLTKNRWLIIVGNSVPVTTVCPGSSSTTEIIEENSILSLDPKCSGFVGTTRVYADYEKNETIQSEFYVPNIQINCCENMPKKEELPPLKPIKINHLNLDEINLADEKLREFDSYLNNMIQEPFMKKHGSAVSYMLVVSVSLILIWIILKYCSKSLLMGYFKGSPSDDDHRPGRCCPQIFNYCNVRSTVSRRPSLHLTATQEPTSQAVIYSTPEEIAVPKRASKLL